MTTAAFFGNVTSPAGFKISGHSTTGVNDENGRLLCAAISSAAIMAANTVTEILHCGAKVDSRDGFLELHLDSPSNSAGAVLAGLRLHLLELQKENPDKIKVISEV